MYEKSRECSWQNHLRFVCLCLVQTDSCPKVARSEDARKAAQPEPGSVPLPRSAVSCTMCENGQVKTPAATELSKLLAFHKDGSRLAITHAIPAQRKPG